MARRPSFQFYPGDWLSDDIAGCSLAAQGLWLRMMIVMHNSKEYGYLSSDGAAYSQQQIARRCGCSVDEYGSLFQELNAAGVPGITPEGIIFSRRMVRDEEERRKEAEKKRLQRGDNGTHVVDGSTNVPTLSPPLSPVCPGNVPRLSRRSSSSSSSSSSGDKKDPPPPPPGGVGGRSAAADGENARRQNPETLALCVERGIQAAEEVAGSGLQIETVRELCDAAEACNLGPGWVVSEVRRMRETGGGPRLPREYAEKKAEAAKLRELDRQVAERRAKQGAAL